MARSIRAQVGDASTKMENVSVSAGSVRWLETSVGMLRCIYVSADQVGASEGCRSGGSQKTPVCFLPGAAGRAEYGAAVIAAASTGGRDAVALDWPGSGESTEANPCWSTRSHAALAWEVLGLLGWARAIVVGHSLGAMVAIHMAEDDRAERVVLLAPTPGLRRCLESGFFPHSLWSIIVLIWSALSLCRLDRVAAQSDLNLAWLLHGLECHSMSNRQLNDVIARFTPRAAAPSGLRVWLLRRLGDVAALVAIMRHEMPLGSTCGSGTIARVPQRLRCEATVVQGSGDRLVLPGAARLAAALWPTRDYHEDAARGHFFHLEADALERFCKLLH